jgi:hypothetical protein
MNNTEFISYLEDNDACEEAISWVGNKSSQEAWDTCQRYNWMEFLLRVAKVELPAEYEAKRAPLDTEHKAKLASIWAEYNVKRSPILAEYLAKRALLFAEHWAKNADLIRELIPVCPA